MKETPEERTARRRHIQKGQARAWDLGLHRLDATLQELELNMIELSDCHLTACDVGPQTNDRFTNLESAATYFKQLARQADDPALRRDATTIVAFCMALLDPQPPKFAPLVKSVLGGTIKPPTDEQLEMARKRAENAFFLAFPKFKTQPYNADTIQAALVNYPDPMSVDEPAVRRLIDYVAASVPGGSQLRPEYDVDLTSMNTPAPVGAAVTVVNAYDNDGDALPVGRTEVTFNAGFNVRDRPALLTYMTSHEAAHVVQFARLLMLLAQDESQVPLHLQACMPTISRLTMGFELGAEALPDLPGLPGAEPAEEGSVDSDQRFHQNVQHWRATSWQAFMLATTRALVTMDTRPDLPLDEALSLVRKWAPDPANEEIFELFFQSIEAFPVLGRLQLAPYVWGAGVLEAARLNGTVEIVADAALQGFTDPTQLEALAIGRSSLDQDVRF